MNNSKPSNPTLSKKPMTNKKKPNPALAIALALTIISGGSAVSLGSQKTLSPQKQKLFELSATICETAAKTVLRLLGDKPKK